MESRGCLREASLLLSDVATRIDTRCLMNFIPRRYRAKDIKTCYMAWPGSPISDMAVEYAYRLCPCVSTGASCVHGVCPSCCRAALLSLSRAPTLIFIYLSWPSWHHCQYLLINFHAEVTSVSGQGKPSAAGSRYPTRRRRDFPCPGLVWPLCMSLSTQSMGGSIGGMIVRFTM